MRTLALGFLFSLSAIGSASAQRWTLAPTASFGYGWSDGRLDHVADDARVDLTPCADAAPADPTCPRAVAAGTIHR